MFRVPALCLLIALTGCISTGIEPPGIVGRVDASLAQENLGQQRGEETFATLTEGELRKLKRVRYLAIPIDEPVGTRSQPRFMIWDTLTEQVIRADFYILARVPSAGTILRLDKSRALVAGSAVPVPVGPES